MVCRGSRQLLPKLAAARTTSTPVEPCVTSVHAAGCRGAEGSDDEAAATAGLPARAVVAAEGEAEEFAALLPLLPACLLFLSRSSVGVGGSGGRTGSCSWGPRGGPGGALGEACCCCGCDCSCGVTGSGAGTATTSTPGKAAMVVPDEGGVATGSSVAAGPGLPAAEVAKPAAGSGLMLSVADCAEAEAEAEAGVVHRRASGAGCPTPPAAAVAVELSIPCCSRMIPAVTRAWDARPSLKARWCDSILNNSDEDDEEGASSCCCRCRRLYAVAMLGISKQPPSVRLAA